MNHLSFRELNEYNIDRAIEAFKHVKFFEPERGEWTLGDWACAMAGEAGEACNLVKKLRRQETGYANPGKDDEVTPEMIADELADVVIYADLLCAVLGIRLDEAVIRKFNEVSVRVGYLPTLKPNHQFESA